MKSWFKFVSALCLATLVLAACAPATPIVIKETVPVEVTKEVEVTKQVDVVQTQVVTAAPAAKTVVRLSGWASSPSETALLESLLYKFSVANPDIVVKYEPITGDYKQALLTAISSGTEPDVFYMDISWWQELAKNGVLMPLDDLMASTATKKEDFIPSLFNAFVFDGKSYGIPKDFNTLGLFYNKDMFDKAKVKYPDENWTWDDLKNAAAKLSDAKNNIYGLGVPADAGRFPIFVFQNGGTIMNADYTDTTLDADKVAAAAKFYTDFRASKTGALPSDVGEGWQGTVFGKGQFAMVYEGGWLIPYLHDQFPNTKYGVALPPKGPGGEGNLIFTVAWGMSKNAKNPDAAWKVINFLTGAEAQQQVLESGFALPTRVALKDSDYFKNNPNSAVIFSGALHGAQPFYWGSVGSDVNDQIGKALERIMKENQAPADSFKDAADKVRTALKNQ